MKVSDSGKTLLIVTTELCFDDMIGQVIFLDDSLKVNKK